MIHLVGRQPFRPQRDQPAAAGPEGGEPDELEDGQLRAGRILTGTTQDQPGRRECFGFVTQGADGGFAMGIEQLDGLVDELMFVVPTGAAIRPAQLGQDFGFRLLAHKVVYHLGNTDFWRNDPLPPALPTQQVTIFLAQIWPATWRLPRLR